MTIVGTCEGMRILSLLGSCQKLGCEVTSDSLPDSCALNMLDVQAIQEGSTSLSVIEPDESTYTAIRPVSSKNVTTYGFVKCSSGSNVACGPETGSDRWIKITPEFVTWLEERERTGIQKKGRCNATAISTGERCKMNTIGTEKYCRRFHRKLHEEPPKQDELHEEPPKQDDPLFVDKVMQAVTQLDQDLGDMMNKVFIQIRELKHSFDTLKKSGSLKKGDDERYVEIQKVLDTLQGELLSLSFFKKIHPSILGRGRGKK